MARKLDISKLAERLTELNSKNNGGGGSGVDFITIKDGKNVVRILPPADNAEWFAKEVFVHYKVGKSEAKPKGTMMVCPTTYGDDKPCPVCELAKELWHLSSKKEDKYDKQAKEIARKKRVYFNAIDRSDNADSYEKNEEGKWIDISAEEEGKEGSLVKVLATGIGVYKDLMALIVDPEYGDVTDPDKGLDVIITKTGTGFNTNYKVTTVRKDTPIGFDEWEECLHDLEQFGKPKTYDEIADVMEGKTTTEKDADEEKDDTPQDTKSNDKVDKEEESTEETDLQAEIKNAMNRRKGGRK